MARRKDSAIGLLVVGVIILAVIGWIVQQLAELSKGTWIALGVIGGIVLILVVVIGVASARHRKRQLLQKYQDPKIVENILRKVVWQGATQEMIQDMLGRPVDIDEKVMKTKTKHVWKYFRKTKTQFGLRITFENGVVVGWDAK